MKINNCLLLITILLSSCGLFTPIPPDIKEAGRISHAFVDEVCKNSPYEPFGMGGSFHDAINGFLIKFRTFQEISEAQAELDICKMYNLLINTVNTDKKIRPYLANWPFSEKETRVGIMFFDPSTKGFRMPPHLATISISNGKMYKTVEDPETTYLLSPEEYEEKYGHRFSDAHEKGTCD